MIETLAPCNVLSIHKRSLSAPSWLLLDQILVITVFLNLTHNGTWHAVLDTCNMLRFTDSSFLDTRVPFRSVTGVFMIGFDFWRILRDPPSSVVIRLGYWMMSKCNFLYCSTLQRPFILYILHFLRCFREKQVSLQGVLAVLPSPTRTLSLSLTRIHNRCSLEPRRLHDRSSLAPCQLHDRWGLGFPLEYPCWFEMTSSWVSTFKCVCSDFTKFPHVYWIKISSILTA